MKNLKVAAKGSVTPNRFQLSDETKSVIFLDSFSCAYCEYFDGGGIRKVEHARKTGETLHGDCLNSLSPRFQTYASQTCDHFYRDSCS